MRVLLPSILIAAAVGLFAMYTNNAYQGPDGIKSLQAQVSAFDEALNKAQELKSNRDQLISKRNTFSTDNIQKLERILPDNVDNIRFVIDINGIAARPAPPPPQTIYFSPTRPPARRGPPPPRRAARPRPAPGPPNHPPPPPPPLWGGGGGGGAAPGGFP